MDFSKETKTLQKAIEFLELLLKTPLDKLSKREVKGVVTTLTGYVDDIYYIDDLMPLEEFADKFDRRKDREAFLNVLDLLDEAFGLLDELLGPEQEDPLAAVEELASDIEESKPEPDAGDLYAELIRNMKPGRHAS